MLRTGYTDRISVNARCLEGVDIFELEVGRYDGRNLMPPGPDALSSTRRRGEPENSNSRYYDAAPLAFSLVLDYSIRFFVMQRWLTSRRRDSVTRT